MIIWIISIIVCALVLFFAFAMGKAAAPRNTRERIVDDYQQMKALGYFKNAEEQKEIIDYINQTITSGCPVENNK